MKDIINKIKIFCHKDNVSFYCSIIGPFLMGTIHLISVIIHFDIIVVNYCIFSYLMLLFKVWQWAIEKYNIKPNNYIAGIISILIVIAPMMASFILTIMYRDAPYYLFEWLVYLYAVYGTIKIILAIRKLLKKDKTDYEYIISMFGLISALYTIQMMQFRLIMFASNGEVGNSMYLMQLFTQGAIFIFSIVVIILFIIKIHNNKRKG